MNRRTRRISGAGAANEQEAAANQRAAVAKKQADAANQRAAVAKKQADAANQRAAVAKKQADALDKKVAKGNISGVTVDHNKSVGGRKGMRINVTFSTANLKDCAVDCNAYFYLKSGSALRDQDGDYRTKSGNVSVGRTVTPKWKNTIYTNFDLFMPYGELHLGPGKWALKFSVSIFHAGDSLDRSNFRSFTYTK